MAASDGGIRARMPAPVLGVSVGSFENNLDILRALRSLLTILRVRDRDLENQVSRAAKSIALNVAEGNRRVGKDRPHLFRIAAGSTDEVRAGLRVGHALGYFTPAQIAEAMDLLDREAAMLYRLTTLTRA
jgi:four helix bundle protein